MLKQGKGPRGQRGSEVDRMTTNRIYVPNLFINSGHVELLRLMPKSSGFVAYLPRAVVEALNLHESDRSLVCFIDDSSNFTYLILVKDNDLIQQLRSVILSKREKVEALHRKMREQMQSQRQQIEAKQNDLVFGIEVEK